MGTNRVAAIERAEVACCSARSSGFVRMRGQLPRRLL